MPNIAASVIGSIALLVSAMGSNPALTDPYHIAAVVGVALHDSAAFDCVESRNVNGALRAHICVARVDRSALHAPASHWSLSFDSTGRVYAAERDWRDNAKATTVRRDSVARAIAMTGAHHLFCPDSVDKSDTVNHRGMSIWRGQTYNALLFQYQSDGRWVLSLQVSPGLDGRCHYSSAEMTATGPFAR
jgi:hypothetical protein